MMPSHDPPATPVPGLLMLAPRLTMGYGVAEAVAMQTRMLRSRGVPTVVGCLEYDGHFHDIPAQRVAPDADAVADLAAQAGAGVIIAHGAPYFDVLPELTGPFRTIAYEYGDPPPQYFGSDAAARTAEVVRKREHVYPNVSAVLAISDFIATDIEWPAAQVVVLGVEHVPDLGHKTEVSQRPVPLRVGAMMRLGSGEAKYKGTDHLLTLAADNPGLSWQFAGRGTDADAEALRRGGFQTLLNPTDEQRTGFLRDIDVFVTLSMWEGTNLPMVEAEALGTPALALATGAHPQFTPFTFESSSDIAAQLHAYDADRLRLSADGVRCYDHVRGSMSWSDNGAALAQLCEGAPMPPPPRSAWRRHAAKAGRVRRAVADEGIRATVSDWRRRVNGPRHPKTDR